MLENLLKSMFGSKHERDVRRATPIVAEVNAHADELAALGDDALVEGAMEWEYLLLTGRRG